MKNTIVLKDSDTNESVLCRVEDITHVSFKDFPIKGAFQVRIHKANGGSVLMKFENIEQLQGAVGQLNMFLTYHNDPRPEPTPEQLEAAQKAAEEAKQVAEPTAEPIAIVEA